jgi:hypothetical protein
MTDISREEKKNIGRQTGVGRDNVAGIEDLDGMSGRDDYAGGDSDGMRNESTNEPTAKF